MYDALVREGYEGTLNGMFYEKLGDLGYEGTLNERERQYWGGTTINGGMYDTLVGAGYSGTVNNMGTNYWNDHRWFTYLNGTSYGVIPSYSISDESWYVSFSCVPSSLLSTRVFGNTENTNSRCVVFANGTLYIVFSDGTVFSTSSVVDVDTLNDVSISYNGATGLISITVNGTLQHQSTISTGLLLTAIDTLGAHNTGTAVSYNTGYLFDINLNGERFYPLNEPYSESGNFYDTTSGEDGTWYNRTSDDVVYTIEANL